MKKLHSEILDLVGEVPTEVIVKKIRSSRVDTLALVGRLAFNAKCASQDLEAHPVEPADRMRFYAILDLIMALGGYTPTQFPA